MPRAARVQSASGIYHVMVRGINKQDIFLTESDHIRYLETLDKVKHEIAVTVLGYCLMSNHAHLLLKEEHKGSISQVMHRTGTSYVRWFNAKYDRVGHLFQGRFLSVPVERDAQFLAVLRYIHRNPVNAGLVSACLEYPWSSHKAYKKEKDRFAGLTDTSLAIQIAGGLPQLLEYINRPSDDVENTVGRTMLQQTHRLSDAEVYTLLSSSLHNKPINALNNMAKEERDRILRRLGSTPGITLIQIARVTGFSRATVSRAQQDLIRR